MRRLVAIACLLIGVPVAGYAAAFTIDRFDRSDDYPVVRVVEGSDCPTEDSCEIDYHDGRWYVTPVTP